MLLSLEKWAGRLTTAQWVWQIVVPAWVTTGALTFAGLGGIPLGFRLLIWLLTGAAAALPLIAWAIHRNEKKRLAILAELRLNKNQGADPVSRPLYVEHHSGRLPAKVSGEGTLVRYILELVESGFNVTRSSRTYSESERSDFDWGQPKPPWAHKLVMTNYGPDTLTGVVLTLDGEAQEVVKTETGSHSGETILSQSIQLYIPKISAGEDRPATMYLQNMTGRYVTFRLAGATATPIGMADPIEIPIATSAFGEYIPVFPAEEGPNG